MLKICKSGIWFDYHGDEVLWKFPWHERHNKNRYVSLCCDGEFKSLKDIDIFWEKYFKEIRK